MQEALLGGLSAQEFLRRNWQKRPLLVRRALPGWKGIASREQLLRLAARPDVESRAVLRSGAVWSVQQGPFARLALRHRATLLVNGVNLHLAAAERLLRRFSFLPQARLDDVMVSWAAPGGGVGPHWDSYDVFLLQGPGRRVWRLEHRRRFAILEGAPLKLIADFRPEEEYLLETGDLLYLPPGWGHDGVALDECITCSVGMRAPRGVELGAALLDYLHERGLPDAEYRDPGLQPAAHAAEIPRRMFAYAAAVCRRVRWSARDARCMLGRYLTTPKPQVVFVPPRRALTQRAFAHRLARTDVTLDARTQMLHGDGWVFLNGEALAPRAAQRAALASLADARRRRGSALVRARLASLLYDWYRAGYLHLEPRK